MWYAQVLRAWCIFNNCACAFAEALLFMIQSHYKSCIFPFGMRWCILAQNTLRPRMCIHSTNEIVRYLVWISF